MNNKSVSRDALRKCKEREKHGLVKIKKKAKNDRKGN